MKVVGDGKRYLPISVFLDGSKKQYLYLRRGELNGDLIVIFLSDVPEFIAAIACEANITSARIADALERMAGEKKEDK